MAYAHKGLRRTGGEYGDFVPKPLYQYISNPFCTYVTNLPQALCTEQSSPYLPIAVRQ